MIPLLLAAGCGDLSNQVFYEDADFLAALPTRETLQISYIEGFEGRPEDFPDALLFGHTLSAIQSADQYLELTTEITEALQSLSPSERGADYRRWGPSEYGFSGVTAYLQVEMTRAISGGSYTTLFSRADSPSGPWTRFYVGHHYVGETVAEGSGDMSWDYSALDGEGALYLDYDLREMPAFYVQLDDLILPESSEALKAQWYYALTEDGGGDLEYTAEVDIGGDSAEPVPEILEIRSRWLADGTGRGDAMLTGGDALGDTEGRFTQCWTVDGVLLAQAAEPAAFEDYFPPVGDPAADCPYPEAAEVENLDRR